MKHTITIGLALLVAPLALRAASVEESNGLAPEVTDLSP